MTTSALAFALRRHILDSATKCRVPGAYPFRAYADDGGLIAYGVELKEMSRRAAIYVEWEAGVGYREQCHPRSPAPRV